jgi:hypothetical protein
VYDYPTALSPDGLVISCAFASQAEHGAEVYDLDGNLLRTLGGHCEFIRTVWLSRDHKIAITHSNDQIRIWGEGGEPVCIQSAADRPFTGKLSVSDDESLVVLTDPEHESVIQGAWTLRGAPVEQPAVPARTSPGFARPAAQDPGYTINWQRTDRGWGYVVRSQGAADQFLAPAKLGRATIASKEPNEFGYAFAWSDAGVEWFVFDPGRIRELLQRPASKASLWELDSHQVARLHLPTGGQ